MITTVLFDLDGTLLPMDQDVFVKAYFGALAKKLAPLGYQPDTFIQAIWTGIAAMVKNDGMQTNEAVFWNTFADIFGQNVRDDAPYFEEFYKTDFQKVKESCGFTPFAAQAVKAVKEKGLRVALATNPVFPAIATESRIRWAGLQPEDFALYTTYENSSCSKPNPAYYQAVCQSLGVTPEECLMIGNDVGDDMIAETLGMKVFLLTDCLINKTQADISCYPHGNFKDLIDFINRL